MNAIHLFYAGPRTVLFLFCHSVKRNSLDLQCFHLAILYDEVSGRGNLGLYNIDFTE